MSKEISGNLQFPVGDVEKYFQPGDFVRVVHGVHKGDSGLVTSVSGNIVNLYSEVKQQEIQVLTSDVQSGSDAKFDVTAEPSKYRTNDLVVYNNSKNMGIVLSVQRDGLNVLDSYGEVKSVRLQDINTKKDTDRICALDSGRNSITKGDTAKVVEGENKGKRGTIVHIYKNIAFLYSPEQLTNNGIFVEKTRNLLILGAELLKGNNEVVKERRGRAAASHKDELYMMQVRMKRGPYKGYQGTVIDVDGQTVKVELSSKTKVVVVNKDDVVPASMRAEAAEVPQPSDMGSRTPAYLPQSPHWVSSTPAPQSPGYGDRKNTSIHTRGRAEDEYVGRPGLI